MNALAILHPPEVPIGYFSGLPLPPPVAVSHTAARLTTIVIDFFPHTALTPEKPPTPIRECPICSDSAIPFEGLVRSLQQDTNSHWFNKDLLSINCREHGEVIHPRPRRYSMLTPPISLPSDPSCGRCTEDRLPLEAWITLFYQEENPFIDGFCAINCPLHGKTINPII